MLLVTMKKIIFIQLPIYLKNLWQRRVVRIAILILMMPGFGYLLLVFGLWLKPFSLEEFQAGYSDSHRIFSRQGKLLREAVNPAGVRARWMPLNDISPLVVAASIAVEDARFYSHSGVDLLAVGRAMMQNIAAGRVVSGASTITMQLSRLLYHHSHSMFGKLGQAFDAVRMERIADKKTILEQYLNRAPYGAGTIGIEAASQRYFGKPNLHLSLAEASLLAGLPKAPSILNPLQNLPAAQKRQYYVLARLLETGQISQEAFKRARREPLHFKLSPPKLAAMHFTDYVLSQSPKPGDVLTTLDSNLQHYAENMVKDHVESLQFGGLSNAAVVVLDNRDCAILVMVGSTDYWHPKEGASNGVIARRQPGSTLKPFMYALAFERGFTPASIVADIETQYLGAEGTLLKPQNYSKLFYGPVLMQEALVRSLNIAAVRTLNKIGVKNFLSRLRLIGFTSLNRDVAYYGLGLTLGNGEVTLLELAQGYAMFARGGLSCQAKVLKDAPTDEPQRIFSESISFLITHILSDESLRIRSFGLANPLLLGFPMAIKTGTSSDWRDNWVVGYTPQYTIAVWAGNFDGDSMNQLSGSIGAGPLFHKIAKLVVYRGAVPQIPTLPEPPADVKMIEVCPHSGMTPTAFCPHQRSVYVLAQDKPLPPCNVHQQLRTDKRNGLLASKRCPSAFVEKKIFEVLPPKYAQWQASHNRQVPPTRYSPYCPVTGITANALVITQPFHGDIYLLEPGYDRNTQTLLLRGEVDPTLPEIAWLIDGTKIATVSWPYDANWPMTKGKHRIEMSGGGMRSDPIEIEVQ